MKKIVKIEPYYEPRMWGGGRRLIDEFHYETDIAPLGEVYNVVALEKHADCFVPEMNMTLSKLYGAYPDWFACETKELPIRVNILDPMADLSIQIHPDDVFAKKYNGGRGKPEAWVILDAPEDGYIEFGHHAVTRNQFETWSRTCQWNKLLRYLKTPIGGFIDIPAGTLHAIGKGVLTYNISRNADCTLRLYDYDRIDPATKTTRPIQVEEVFENVNIPDRLIEFEMFPSASEHGCHITRYWDEPGLYTLYRIEVEKKGRFLHDRFAFYTCVKGEGTINKIAIRQGETVLVPCDMGWIELEGNMDLFMASYRNEHAKVEHPKLQMALDDVSIERAMELVDETYGSIDIVEVGTPMIIKYGVEPIRKIKDAFPDLEVLADTKIMDAGFYEAQEAFEAGADYVTVLGVADDGTIRGCGDAARKYNGQVVADMICVNDLEERAFQLEKLGVDFVAVHVGVDQQAKGRTPLDDLKVLKKAVKNAKVSVAGGIAADTIKQYRQFDPNVIIVGSGLVHHEDPKSEAKRLKEELESE